MTVHCIVCGGAFQAKRLSAIYCSASCRQKAVRQRRQERTTTRYCPRCGGILGSPC